MKTRMITSTMVVLFATATLVSATTSRTANPSVASSHENATEQSFTELIPNYPASAGTLLMEEWIDSRNQWEQYGVNAETMNLSFDAAMLEEWAESRDSWEQKEADQAVTPVNPTLLEDWTASAENWEQR